MTVETTVQWMFDKYPLMYSTREECFDQLFCTIGNGYKWKWGQLISISDNEDFNEEEAKKWNDDDYVVDHPRASQSKKNLEDRRKHDELYVKHGLMKKVGEHTWYPLSKRYSRLFTIPTDAREDWKAAVEECKKMLEKDGIDWRNAK